MKLAPYPKYKPSGVEWLGEVPAHWEVKRLKDYGTLFSGTGFPDQYQGVSGEALPFYKVSDLIRSSDNRYMGLSRHTVSLETAGQLRARVIPTGAIIYAKIGAALYLNRRRISTTECCIDNNMTAYVPTPGYLLPEWAFYWTSIIDFGEFANPGAIPSLGEKYQATLLLVLPTLREQKIITNFLNCETAKIDTLIRKKQALIERLQEKRAALITRTVTRGLPPDAARAAGLEPEPKMKASGVEWLQEIPGHWGYKGISLLARRGAKMFTDGDWVELPYITTDGIRLLQTGNIGVGQYREQGFRYIDESSFTELRCTEVQPADVLICRLADPVGRACLAPDLGCRMITSVDVCILKPADFMDARYIVYLLSSKGYLDFVESICRGGTRDRISRSMLGAIRVPVPSRLEQRAIADFLDRETAKIDGLVAKVETAIARLREYRAALITAAVTGQVDVRGEGP